jgi:general secretion pathway protein G
MVVVMILGLLAAMVATNVIDRADEARRQRAQMDVVTIANAVKAHRATTGALPASIEALAAKDARGRSDLDDLSLDPWNREYLLRLGETAAEFEVVSLGPDGCEGTTDDITSRRARAGG